MTSCHVQYWGSLRPCLVTTSGSLATRPIPPNPRVLARPSPTDARRLAQRGVGESVQRRHELALLARDEREAFLLLGGPVQPLELRRNAVEAREQRVELAVADLPVSLYLADSRQRPGG